MVRSGVSLLSFRLCRLSSCTGFSHVGHGIKFQFQILYLFDISAMGMVLFIIIVNKRK